MKKENKGRKQQDVNKFKKQESGKPLPYGKTLLHKSQKDEFKEEQRKSRHGGAVRIVS